MDEYGTVRDVPSVGLQIEPFNWPLRRAREAKGWTRKALSEATGIQQNSIGAYEALKDQPSEANAIRIALALGRGVSELFPDEVLALKRGKRTPIEVPVPADMVRMFAAPDAGLLAIEEGDWRRDLAERLEAAKDAANLTPSERDVLDMRFGERLTLDACGERIGKTKERVRQLEAHALTKLRHPRSAKLVRSYAWGEDAS